MNSRLQRLRELLRLEWGELADHLGMSRAMLDFVRKGQRNLSFKALSRLEEAERAVGISPPLEPIVGPRTPAPASSAGMVKEKEEIYSVGSAREELREIGAALHDLAERLQRLEKQVYK